MRVPKRAFHKSECPASKKSVQQECPKKHESRVSRKSVLQGSATKESHKIASRESFHKSVPRECPTRVPHKSVPQEFFQSLQRVSHKSILQGCLLQECPTSVLRKSVPQDRLLQGCPTKVRVSPSYKSVLQKCPARVPRKSVAPEFSTRASHKSAPRECPTRVSCKSVSQECLTRVPPQECQTMFGRLFSSACLHAGLWVPSCFLRNVCSYIVHRYLNTMSLCMVSMQCSGQDPAAHGEPLYLDVCQGLGFSVKS